MMSTRRPDGTIELLAGGFLSRRGLLRVGGGTMAAAAGLPLLTGEGMAAALQGDPQPGGDLTFGLSADPPNLDPHVDSGAAASTIKQLVYSTMVRYWLGGELQPNLADSWEISDDGLEYTFALRPGVTFHDGAPFTAEDVKASIERMQDEAVGATLQVEMSAIEEVVAEDELTVRLRLGQPNPAMIEYLAQPDAAIMSKAFLDAGTDPNTTMLGTGPFTFVSREPGVRTELARNEGYFREGLPYLDRIIFVPYTDENTRVSALLGGEIDIADYVPWKDMQTVEDDPNLKLALGQEAAFMCVIYNVEEPPFDNPLVRSALSYAYDRQAIVDAVFFGRGSTITGGLIPSSSWAHNAELDGTYPYDPARAQELLAEAGFADGFSVTLLSTSQYGMHQSSAEIAQQNLQAIGIDCQLELFDWSTVVQRQTEGSYQFRIHGLSPELVDPDFLTNFFASGSAFSRSSNFADEEIDRLLAEGRTTLDEAARKEIYLQLERRLLELSPWTFLSWREQGEGLKEEIQGYEHLPGSTGFKSAVTLEQAWRPS
jgi:glutathione transport system substrate-binding protein